MNSGTSKDFLLILSFPRYLRRPAIISSLLPSAISLCSEVRGLRRCTNPEQPDTSQCQGRNVSMVPRSRSSGQQYKLSPPGTEPPLTPLLTSPILPPVLSHISALPPHTPHTKTGVRGWLDGFFLVLRWDLAEQKSWHLQGEVNRRGPVVGRVVWSLKENGAAWQRWLHRSPRFGLMAPLGPTYCWWSDGLLGYEATRPGARFHIHFSPSLSKTLNDFPKIDKWEFNRGGAECAIEVKRVK